MIKNNDHDLRLYSGERQTAAEYSSIRADHRYRYEWAKKIIPSGAFGMDVFCGNGYGTWYLAEDRFVLGVDGSPEAIEFANMHYRRQTNFFSTSYYPFELPKGVFDFVVALESIEHVKEGDEFFLRMCDSLKPGGDLIFSTPCEDCLPLSATGNHFHHRHYSMEETLRMANSNNMTLQGFAGQDVYQLDEGGLQGELLSDADMKLKAGAVGQFLIVHARKKHILKKSNSLRFNPFAMFKARGFGWGVR